MAEDPILAELLLKYEEEISAADEVLCNNSKYRDDSEIEQLVADLYYQYGLEMWGDEYDIVLGGGFIRTRSPYNLYAGEIRFADVYSVLPFDNQIVLCSISGRDLKNKFINTTNTDYYISGENLSSLTINDNATYYIVVDTYTSSYSYNNLTVVERGEEGLYARNLFADYIKKYWN